MSTLTEVLEVNWIILYFVYGLVFFIMGLVTGLQWRRHSHLELARPLPWLAAFGIAHGLNEWGHIFIPLQALYLPDLAVRLMVVAHLLLLAVSYFFLFQFGVELILPLLSDVDRLHRWLRALPAAVLLLWGLAVFLRGMLAQDPLSVLVAIGNGWARYALCFPGATMAGIGLLHQARDMWAIHLPRIAFYLNGAAIAFFVYAIVGGLVVPTAPVFPASLLNYALLDRTVHVPAPVFRSLCGLAMAFFVVRSLEVFQVEDDRRLAEMENAQLLAADRERIGRDLHDGIIQGLYAAGLGLHEAQYLVDENPDQARQKIDAVMGMLNKSIEDIRRYIFDLRPADQPREIETVLADLVQDVRLDTLLEVQLEIRGQRCCWLGPDEMAHITQIAREAFSNVVQHADATHVEVILEYRGEYIRLAVVDDGHGMDLDLLQEDGSPGHGIGNMQKRADMLGGEMVLQSSPGQGFSLVLIIPCEGKTVERQPGLETTWA